MVPATYYSPDLLRNHPRVVCAYSGGKEYGIVPLTVSLDGQSWSESSVDFVLGETDPSNMVTEHQVVEDGFYGFYDFYSQFYFYNSFYEPYEPTPPALGDPAMHTLDFLPKYCVGFPLGFAADATLSNLILQNPQGSQDPKSYSPSFSPETTAYHAKSYSINDEIMVTAFPANPMAKIYIAGRRLDSEPAIIDLQIGSNLIEIEVEAENTIHHEKYYITVELIPDTRLKALGHDLLSPISPAFDGEDVFEYSLTASVRTSAVTFFHPVHEPHEDRAGQVRGDVPGGVPAGHRAEQRREVLANRPGGGFRVRHRGCRGPPADRGSEEH